jgi:hypothetical protein
MLEVTRSEIPRLFDYILFFFVVLKMELRALLILGKHSAIELQFWYSDHIIVLLVLAFELRASRLLSRHSTH